MQSKILIALAVILSLGIGIFIGNMMSKDSSSQDVVISGDKYQAGWSAAMQSLKDAGSLSQIPEGTEIKSVDGKIKTISGNTITLQITTPGLMKTPELATRTVTVDAKTKIVQLVQKDPVQFQEELDAFNEKNKQQTAPQVNEDEVIAPQSMPTPPVAQSMKTVAVGDLKVGQSISVQSAMEIKNIEKFIATEIKIMQDVLDPATMPKVPSAPNPEAAKIAPPAPEAVAPTPPTVK